MAETVMGRRVLVVEDDGIIAARLQSILTRLGYAVPAVVASGEEAIRQAAAVRPELVLMDIRLAGDMDGIEAGEQIGDQLGIPLIYLTAYMDEALLQRAKLTRPYGYMVKPVQDRELRAAIELALYRHCMDRQLRQSEARYHAVVAQAVEGILLFDAGTGRILEANPTFQQMLGYAAEDIAGLTVYDVMAHEPAEVDRDIAAVLKAGQRPIGRRRWRCKDGSRLDVEVNASLLAVEGPPVVCLVARDSARQAPGSGAGKR